MRAENCHFAQRVACRFCVPIFFHVPILPGHTFDLIILPWHDPPPCCSSQHQCHLASNFEIAPGLPPPPRVNAGTIILGLSNFCEAALTIDAPYSFHRRPCAGRSFGNFLGESTLSPRMCIHCRRNACGGCGCSVAEVSLCVMSLFALLFLSICPRFQIATHLLPLLSDYHISKWGLLMVWPVGYWWW